jgi:hypothetical protein
MPPLPQLSVPLNNSAHSNTSPIDCSPITDFSKLTGPDSLVNAVNRASNPAALAGHAQRYYHE